MILCGDERVELVRLAERDVESARRARELWRALRGGEELRVVDAPVLHEGHLTGTESWRVTVREPHKLPEVIEGLCDVSQTARHVALLDLFLLLWACGARAHAATLLLRANEEQRCPTPVYEGGVYVGDSRTAVVLPKVSEHPSLPWETEASYVARALRDSVHFGRAYDVRELEGWCVEWASGYARRRVSGYEARVGNERADLATCEEWRREHVQHYLGEAEKSLEGWRGVAASLASLAR